MYARESDDIESLSAIESSVPTDPLGYSRALIRLKSRPYRSRDIACDRAFRRSVARGARIPHSVNSAAKLDRR